MASLFKRALSGCVWWLRWGMNSPMYVTMPRKDCNCCLSAGGVRSSMPCSFFGSGLIPSFEKRAPKKVTCSFRNSSFLPLRTSPSSWQTFKKFTRFESCSSLVLPYMTTSSWMPMTPGHFSSIWSIRIWNTSWLILAPKGILLYRSLPLCQLNTVSSLERGVRCICKKALWALAFVKNWAPASS